MGKNTLPKHPVTGLTALGFTRRGPIWPVIGGDGSGDGPTGDQTPEPDAQDPAGDPPAPGTDKAPKEFQPITSQEDFDKRIGQRIGAVRAEYKDHDIFKASHDEYQKYLESQKTDEDKRAEEDAKRAEWYAAVEKENETLKTNQLRAEIAQAKGLTPKMAARLRGSTKEELEADADDLLADIPSPVTPPASDRPEPKGGGNPEPDAIPFDVDAIVNRIRPSI